MKNLRILAVTILLFTGIAATFAKDKPTTKKVTYECSVDCHKCTEKIMKNIPYEKGVKEVSVDIPNQLVTVSFRDDKNTTEGVEKALEKLGYEVKVKKQATKKK